jgi:hypothetical protein
VEQRDRRRTEIRSLPRSALDLDAGASVEHEVAVDARSKRAEKLSSLRDATIRRNSQKHDTRFAFHAKCVMAGSTRTKYWMGRRWRRRRS